MSQVLCKKEDLVAYSGRAARVEDTQIALFYFPEENEVLAINNLDPFTDVNVLCRGITGSLNGQKVVASPIYKQHFNLETGLCLEDESISVSTYHVGIDDDGQVIFYGPKA